MKAAFDVLAKGGLVMIPLGLCSVLALAVVIERAFRWLKLGGVSEADRDRLFDTLSSMKTNLLGRLATAGERRASHG